MTLHVQGGYLGELLSESNGEILTQSPANLEKKGVAPFNYSHMGSFAYVGDNKAVLQLPIIGEASHTHTHTHTHTEACTQTVSMFTLSLLLILIL